MKYLSDNALSQSKLFLNALFGNMHSDGWLILWKPDKKSVSVPVSDLDQAAEITQALKSGHNVYFGLGLQGKKPSEWSRGKADGVMAIPGLWLDMDIAGPGHKETRIPPDQETAIEFLNGLPWEPTILVHSGGGIHAYWLFKEPWVFDDKEERIKAQEVSERFQAYVKRAAKEKHGWHLDSTHDLARVLRVPGTLNHKSNPPVQVKIIAHDDSCRYNPGDFDEYVESIVLTSDYRTEFPGSGSWPPAAIEPIVQGCSFMRHCLDDAKTLPEPHWLSMLTILGRCENAASLAHEWSSPYPRYSPQKTDKKLEHATDENSGPRTCQFIETAFQFDPCKSCPNHGKVRSPIQLGAPKPSKAIYSLSSKAEKDDRWHAIREHFPRTAFPWGVLPKEIAESLNQLARSCATSPNSLPGVALSILASTLGNRVMVSPKESWKEPMIFWHADIRESGEGKTPASNLLVKPLHLFQAREHERFEDAMARYRANERKPRGEQDNLREPSERRFFTTDFTMEGLSAALAGNPLGGLFIDVSELSILITSQNQYKPGGADRENWIKMWDGNPVGAIRKSKSIYLPGPRVSVAGGIQPRVFREVFGGRGGLYLEDGTIYRFLYVHESHTFRELTSEPWSESNMEAWGELLNASRKWAEGEVQPMDMVLSPYAQRRFTEWRNDLASREDLLPREFRLFLSKAYSYCLRLMGVLHCLWAFSHDCKPNRELGIDDLDRGIRAVEFYLGQAVDAMMTLLGIEGPKADEKRAKLDVLAEALENVRVKVSSKGRVLVSDIMEAFNELMGADGELFDDIKPCAAFLRDSGLNAPVKAQRCDGGKGTCLNWDSKVDDFISRHQSA